MKTMQLPMDLALIRWSVVCRSWYNMAYDAPDLGAFLAGWYCRCSGVSRPADEGMFRNSFRRGWREADQEIEIKSREPIT